MKYFWIKMMKYFWDQNDEILFWDQNDEIFFGPKQQKYFRNLDNEIFLGLK